MGKYEERKRQWPNMASLLQQANNDHETLKNKIRSLNADSEIEVNVASIFPDEYFGHRIKFESIYPQTSYIIIKRYVLEKGIYVYQVIWQPKEIKDSDTNFIEAYYNIANETIQITRNDFPFSLKTLKATASSIVYNKKCLLFQRELDAKKRIELSSFDVSHRLIDPAKYGHNYNKEKGMYNPIIAFYQVLCSEEESKKSIRKSVILRAAQNVLGEYNDVVQLNTSNNNCYIKSPDSIKFMPQAQIERWIVANSVEAQEYQKLMEMMGYFDSSKEVAKLVKLIRI